MKHKVRKIKLNVTFLKEGKQFIAFCPSLDISTSASTFEKAKKRFEELVDIFFNELEKEGTLDDVLIECGWTRDKKTLVPPQVISQTQETFEVPCLA